MYGILFSLQDLWDYFGLDVGYSILMIVCFAICDWLCYEALQVDNLMQCNSFLWKKKKNEK